MDTVSVGLLYNTEITQSTGNPQETSAEAPKPAWPAALAHAHNAQAPPSSLAFKSLRLSSRMPKKMQLIELLPLQTCF